MDSGKVTRILLGLLVVLGLWLGSNYRYAYINNPARHGETMGTTYSIRITGRVKKDRLDVLTRLVDAELKEISRQMSTWDRESEISRFNHFTATDPFAVSADFAKVVERALCFSRATGGAFDPTLQPLLNLWGFGSEAAEHGVPPDDALAAARAKTGWHKLTVSIAPPTLQKSAPEVSLALGAIAKGYGVDAIAGLLDAEGFTDWFVEIGGEVAVRGLNPEGIAWKIGIQYPDTDWEDDRLQGILHLSQGAVATSGDYRNYIEKDGIIYSHILDPRTGRAVYSRTASVSVYAANCTDADAAATALFVMGPAEGLAWIEQRPGLEALFLVRDEEGSISERFSSGFIGSTGYIPCDDANRE
jgi:thiamine biosynthesis lipoprotein